MRNPSGELATHAGSGVLGRSRGAWTRHPTGSAVLGRSRRAQAPWRMSLAGDWARVDRAVPMGFQVPPWPGGVAVAQPEPDGRVPALLTARDTRHAPGGARPERSPSSRMTRRQRHAHFQWDGIVGAGELGLPDASRAQWRERARPACFLAGRGSDRASVRNNTRGLAGAYPRLTWRLSGCLALFRGPRVSVHDPRQRTAGTTLQTPCPCVYPLDSVNGRIG